jgi:hypothetical protein
MKPKYSNDSSTSVLLNEYLILGRSKTNATPREDTSLPTQPSISAPKPLSISDSIDNYFLRETSINNATPTPPDSHDYCACRPDAIEIDILYKLTIEPYLPVAKLSFAAAADSLYRKVMSAADFGPTILHKMREKALEHWNLYNFHVS